MSLSCLGIIPARAGSKGIPGKNMRSLAGRPLVMYTFDAAKESCRLTRTILSSDSEEIVQLGRAAGIDVPFLRPAELARDDTRTLVVLRHALEYLAENEGYRPDIVVNLQPTAPLRRGEHIDQCIDLLCESGADSVVSVAPVPRHYNPHWQFIVEDGELRIFTKETWAELVPRRQDLPTTYTRNGAIYAFWRRNLETTGTVYGSRCVPFVMPSEISINIDDMQDWIAAEAQIVGELERRD